MGDKLRISFVPGIDQTNVELTKGDIETMTVLHPQPDCPPLPTAADQ